MKKERKNAENLLDEKLVRADLVYQYSCCKGKFVTLNSKELLRHLEDVHTMSKDEADLTLLEIEQESFEELMSKEYGEENRKLDKCLKDLKQKSIDNLVKELIDFAEREYPEMNRPYLPYEVIQFFWLKKGIPNEHMIEDPELKLKMVRVKEKAQAIIDERFGIKRKTIKSEGDLPSITRKTIQEIVNSILEFAKKELHNFIEMSSPVSHVIQEFWKINGLDRYGFGRFIDWQCFDATVLVDKLNKVDDLVRPQLKTIIDTARAEKQKELLDSTVPKLIEWLREKSVPKVTKGDIELFLAEQKVIVTRKISNFKDALYHSVITKYQPIREEKPMSKKVADKKITKSKLRLDEQKQLIESLLPQLIDWLKSKGSKKATRVDVELFILEKEVCLPDSQEWIIKQMLYRLAREQFKETSVRGQGDDERKQILESLLSHLVDWVKSKGLKKVTMVDVELFVLEKEVPLPDSQKHSIKRMLYRLAKEYFKKTNVMEQGTLPDEHLRSPN